MLAGILLFPYKGGAEEKPRDLAPLLEPVRAKHDLPALAAPVFRGEKIDGAGAAGKRKYRGSEPVTIDDQFHMGSDTKAMTATLLATFVEQGKLRWDDTLEQLLAHAAGLSDDTAPKGVSLVQLRQWSGTTIEQRASYVGMVLQEAPVNKPGSTFLYSNRSYVVAGAIAERLGSRPWEALMQERIFDPLGMHSCGSGAAGTPGKWINPGRI